jgi:hypothetical protein
MELLPLHALISNLFSGTKQNHKHKRERQIRGQTKDDIPLAEAQRQLTASGRLICCARRQSERFSVPCN